MHDVQNVTRKRKRIDTEERKDVRTCRRGESGMGTESKGGFLRHSATGPHKRETVERHGLYNDDNA